MPNHQYPIFIGVYAMGIRTFSSFRRDVATSTRRFDVRSDRIIVKETGWGADGGIRPAGFRPVTAARYKKIGSVRLDKPGNPGILSVTMNEQPLVRIVLWVTPEEKQLMSEAAMIDDRPLTRWAIRALRVALDLSPSPAPLVPELEMDAAPVVASVVPTPALVVASVVPQWTPQPPKQKPAVFLRPDGKPYELGFPCTVAEITYHSSEEWQASPAFAAYNKGT